jgi:outer membrane protein insertion porin family
MGNRHFRRAGACLLALLLACTASARAGEEGYEGRTVVAIRVSGATTTPPDRVRHMMTTRQGEPLRMEVLESDFERLKNSGLFAEVQIKLEDAAGGVRVIVVVREKDIIRRILIRGNRRVSENKLEELIQVQVGQRYDPGLATRDARAIEDFYKEEFYYFADVTPETEPFEDGIRLVFRVDEGGQLYVRDIEFRGNGHFSRKELLKYMETKPTTFFTRGKYDRRAFVRDLERLRILYKNDGFLDVEITEQPFRIVREEDGSRREAYITVDIDEGPRYRIGQITFEGNRLVETGDLLAVVESMPGDYISPMTLREDADRIRDEYGKYPSSRYFTQVRVEQEYTETGNVVDVHFNISEGEEVVVEDVQVLGLTKSRPRVVLREIDQLPGEKIDSRKINESQRRIHNLGYFKDVNFEVVEGSAPSRARVVVDIGEELPTGRLVLGAGVSSKESFIASIELKQRNFDYSDWPETWKEFFTGQAFVGAGQDFSLKLSRGSKSESYTFDFTEPWWFNRPLRFGFGGFYNTWEWNRYDEERLGGYVRLGRRLWVDDLNGTITYRLERVTLENFDDHVSPSLRSEEGTNWISRVILAIAYDTRDSRWDPTEGIRLSASQEFAGTVLGGDRDFWRSFLGAHIFHPFYRDTEDRPWYLSLRGDIGMGEAIGDDDTVPIYERMYAGGIGSIRGFGHNRVAPRDAYGDEIGGELVMTGSVEVFVPVWEDIIKVSGFYDIGQVWPELDGPSDEDYRSSAGIGLHFKTPLGPMPIRLYFSRVLSEVEGDDKESFQFTFGALF